MLSAERQAQQRLPSRGDCTYTACYCEENALLLARRLRAAGAAPAAGLWVVFVTNPRRQVPLWCQRASSRPDGLVVWDYHVLVVEGPHGGLRARAWDLDTALPFPCPLDDYAAAALPPVRQRYARRYRVVPAEHLERHFASDRSHMRRPDGSWAAPPPLYPCFVAASDGCTNRLAEYLHVGLPGDGDCSDDGGSGAESTSSEGGGGGDGGDKGGGSVPPLSSLGNGPAAAAAAAAAAAVGADLGRVLEEEEFLAFFLGGSSPSPPIL
ncbi:hypothetical protein Rsub_00909 [Raphidocelis subcapitata]|uniref:Protein N-terminal glutamine amidohydrolase n=1 Tax=Raphidocelis subcapitata TaxID=307507 RepID=A0A2V0NTE1_9CHLO|nr:hypothetical protein Rsub_00909 [Raphidocelis subcapitata]|eukprot:GBF88197.1 hypothetical protein Rsub_00909 [Raphidocelis subcapitata]